MSEDYFFNEKNRKHNYINLAHVVIATAIMGYTLGYSKVYLFHIVSFFWILRLIFVQRIIRKDAIYQTNIISFIIIYSLISLVWSSNIENSIRYVFYFSCAWVCVLSVNISSQNFEGLRKCLNLILFFIGLNIFVGFLESLGVLRLPMSPFSPYINYFGHSYSSEAFENIALGNIVDDFPHMPTGFDYNQNNFAFVFSLFLPFFVFNRRRVVKILAVFLAVWFTLTIGSKGLILSLLVFFIMNFLFSNKNIMKLTFLLVTMVGILLFVLLNNESSYYFLVENRAFSLFEQLNKGIDLISSGYVSYGDSTETRAFLYFTGLQQLILSNGLGLGIAGITSYLQQIEFPMTSFHFFILEMLVDLGVIVFTICIYFYFRLYYRLRVITKFGKTEFDRYLGNSASNGLIIALVGSISPSSIIYILSFWVFIGLATAIAIRVKV